MTRRRNAICLLVEKEAALHDIFLCHSPEICRLSLMARGVEHPGKPEGTTSTKKGAADINGRMTE
jgi:hypothetical protein